MAFGVRVGWRSSMSNLSIVIPAYNEAAHIDRVVRDLLDSRDQIKKETGLSSVEVIVVDDGSTDGTGGKLKTLAQSSNGQLKVITHEVNCGYGAALKTGFGEASGQYLSFMDADGTLIGVISLDQVRRVMNEQIPPDLLIARDLMVTDSLWVTPQTDLAEALRLFSSVRLEEIVVWDPETRTFAGLLSRAQLTRTYVERMAKLGAS